MNLFRYAWKWVSRLILDSRINFCHQLLNIKWISTKIEFHYASKKIFSSLRAHHFKMVQDSDFWLAPFDSSKFFSRVYRFSDRIISPLGPERPIKLTMSFFPSRNIKKIEKNWKKSGNLRRSILTSDSYSRGFN